MEKQYLNIIKIKNPETHDVDNCVRLNEVIDYLQNVLYDVHMHKDTLEKEMEINIDEFKLTLQVLIEMLGEMNE